MSANIWKSYTLRSYEVVVKKRKKYWCPYGISTHNHCGTGTALYGNVPNGPKFFRALFSLHWNSASDRESLLEFSGPITEGSNS